MTRHHKRPRKRAVPGATEQLDNASSSSGPVLMKTSSSRIEVRGLDMELVPEPANGTLDFTGTSAPEQDSGNARAEAETAKLRESEALRAELREIAVVLDLPSKRIQRPPTTSNVVVSPSPRSVRQFVERAAHVVVFVGLLIAASTLRSPAAPALPEALLGSWITTNPSYQGRELGFVESELVMRVTPEAPLTRYPITSLSSRTVADTTVLGMIYVAEGGPTELHARLITGPNPTLVFDRPSGLVWERRVY
jgi:hypothetical protein